MKLDRNVELMLSGNLDELKQIKVNEISDEFILQWFPVNFTKEYLDYVLEMIKEPNDVVFKFLINLVKTNPYIDLIDTNESIRETIIDYIIENYPDKYFNASDCLEEYVVSGRIAAKCS